jgi:hypothetical protein
MLSCVVFIGKGSVHFGSRFFRVRMLSYSPALNLLGRAYKWQVLVEWITDEQTERPLHLPLQCIHSQVKYESHSFTTDFDINQGVQMGVWLVSWSGCYLLKR